MKILEDISKEVFKSHYEILNELVGNSHGVYALYDDEDLYYVGKSKALKKRVRKHISDKHFGNWNRFSVYLVLNEEHVEELESLLIRIFNPKGNANKPQNEQTIDLKHELIKRIKQKDKEKLAELVGQKKKKSVSVVISSRAKHNTKGLVSRKTPLYRTYKGESLVAYLYASGVIKFKNKDYSSPSAAARAAIGPGKHVNGWRFWYVKDVDGALVKLEELRG